MKKENTDWDKFAAALTELADDEVMKRKIKERALYDAGFTNKQVAALIELFG